MLRSTAVGLVFCGWCLAVTSVAQAQTEEQIEASRLKGIKFLKEQQHKEGHWDYDGDLETETHNVGITALCTIALIENGVSHNDPVIRKGYAYVLNNTGTLTNTYDLSLTVVMLSRMGDRRDRLKIKSLAARLISGQLKTGGWSYSCPLADPGVLDNPRSVVLKDGVGDNSCTQFAVLGLWVASRANVNIDRTLSGVALRFVTHQKPDGGWDYALDPAVGSGPSMTGAGLFCLAVSQANRIRGGKVDMNGFNVIIPPKENATAAVPGTGGVPPAAGANPGAAAAEKKPMSDKKVVPDKKPAATTAKPGDPAATAETPSPTDDPPVKSLVEHPIFKKGLQRTGQFVKGIGPGSPKYFLWSIERIGVLLGLEEIEGTNWYQKGCAALVQTQQEDGSWVEAEKSLATTSFSILFLRKANLGSDVSRLLEGESPQKFQIHSREDQPRFDTLEQALAAAQPGETIRIEGNGPWPVKHLELSKDVTLQAGFGYKPVFTFTELGADRLGIRLRPDREPKALSAILVQGGKITLEGIHLQLDPPLLKPAPAWAGITINGGSLRLLNCTISEGNRQGGSAVVMAAPGQLIIRNSLLTGGRSGVEVVGNGTQEVILDNSAIYSTTGIRVVNDAKTKKPAAVGIKLVQTSVQGNDAFATPNLVGKVAIDSERCAYLCTWMGSDFLASATSANNRSFKGLKNIYDVKDFLGAKGKKNAAVTDAKTWATFWGGSDKDSFKRIAAFVVIRQHGAFGHHLNIMDWQVELPGNAEVVLLNSNIGVDSFLAGSGPSYDQYRDTIAYRSWERGQLVIESEVASAAP